MTTASAELPWLAMPTDASGDGGKGNHRGGDGGDKLQEWSSLIGIITAIVGNVLIALALNVQRYAHTRLHKERRLVRLKAHAALKRAQSTGGEPGTYGTIIDRPETGPPRGFEHRSDSGNGNGNRITSGHSHPAEDGDDEVDDDDDDLEDGREYHEYREDEPLAASFQSSSSTRDDSETHIPKPTMTYLKSPYWWLGQILITLGEMGNFLAYGFAPASIVSPLGVVALVSNCIIAPAMFHEKFRPRDFWGVLIAVSGVVTVVWSANQEETKLGPHDVWGAITTLEFEIYMGVTALLIVTLMWASTRYGKRTILIDLGLVGLFGGYTALSTKGVSSMLSSTLWGAFKTPVTYALLFVLLLTAIMQIRYVNKALQRFDSTQVIPIQFVMFTLCVIVGSAVLYRDFEKTTAEQAGKFIGGCLLTFFGVFLITSGREKRDDDDNNDLLSEADGIEETIGLSQHDGTLSFPPYQDDPTQRPSCSRSSSKLPRLDFTETSRQESYRDDVGRDPSLLHPGAVPEQNEALVSNPWQNSWNVPSAPARGIRTISAESVATRSALGLAPTHSHSTMPRPSRDHHQRSFSTDRPVTSRGHSYRSSIHHHHRPRTFISPSPLSSTFTTVVKDAFLREGELSAANRPSTRRTLRSSIRASLFFDDEERGTEGGAAAAAEQPAIPEADDDHQSRSSRAGPVEGDDATRRRSRSLSDAISDFFRVKSHAKEGELGGSDEANPHHGT